MHPEILRHHLLDALEASFCFGGRSVGEDELARDLAHLLLVHQLSAALDHIVILFEINNGLSICRSFSAQALDPVLQPPVSLRRV